MVSQLVIHLVAKDTDVSYPLLPFKLNLAPGAGKPLRVRGRPCRGPRGQHSVRGEASLDMPEPASGTKGCSGKEGTCYA